MTEVTINPIFLVLWVVLSYAATLLIVNRMRKRYAFDSDKAVKMAKKGIENETSRTLMEIRKKIKTMASSGYERTSYIIHWEHQHPITRNVINSLIASGYDIEYNPELFPYRTGIIIKWKVKEE